MVMDKVEMKSWAEKTVEKDEKGEETCGVKETDVKGVEMGDVKAGDAGIGEPGVTRRSSGRG